MLSYPLLSCFCKTNDIFSYECHLINNIDFFFFISFCLMNGFILKKSKVFNILSFFLLFLVIKNTSIISSKQKLSWIKNKISCCCFTIVLRLHSVSCKKSLKIMNQYHQMFSLFSPLNSIRIIRFKRVIYSIDWNKTEFYFENQ